MLFHGQMAILNSQVSLSYLLRPLIILGSLLPDMKLICINEQAYLNKFKTLATEPRLFCVPYILVLTIVRDVQR